MFKPGTPWHAAVICDDRKAFSTISPSELSEENADGLTPLELAKLLGRDGILEILGIISPPIKLWEKGHGHCDIVSPAEFYQRTGVIYRPWYRFANYQLLKEAIRNCPWTLRWRWLSEENQELGRKYASQIWSGKTADLMIRWIDPRLGYGLFADEDIHEGDLVGEYTGEVRRLFRKHPDQNEYCFQYPTRWWAYKYFTIDALKEGNYLRFANHSDSPNMIPKTVVEKGLLHHLFFANRFIPKGKQLTFDYGEDYWKRREKIPIFS